MILQSCQTAHQTRLPSDAILQLERMTFIDELPFPDDCVLTKLHYDSSGWYVIYQSGMERVALLLEIKKVLIKEGYTESNKLKYEDQHYVMRRYESGKDISVVAVFWSDDSGLVGDSESPGSGLPQIIVQYMKNGSADAESPEDGM